jgi:hypothetical protein
MLLWVVWEQHVTKEKIAMCHGQVLASSHAAVEDRIGGKDLLEDAARARRQPIAQFGGKTWVGCKGVAAQQ